MLQEYETFLYSLRIFINLLFLDTYNKILSSKNIVHEMFTLYCYPDHTVLFAIKLITKMRVSFNLDFVTFFFFSK